MKTLTNTKKNLFKAIGQNLTRNSSASRLISFLLPFLFFLNFKASAQADWKLNIDKEGVKVYTLAVPDSKVKAIKVVSDVNATPAQLVSLIMDVNSSAEWIYHTKSCELIRQVSPTEIYYYSEVSLPWPVANRDFVAHLKVSQDPDTKVVTIDGPAVQGMVPEKKGIVRITNSTGKWTITPEGPNEVKVEYVLHVEPGGNIPAWLTNMFAAEGPLQIFKNMKVQLQKPQYKNTELPFIANKYASVDKF